MDLNLADASERPAFHVAAESGFFELCEALAHHAAFAPDVVDGEGRSALHIAIGKGYRDVAVQLLQRKLNVNSVDKDGLTALHVAVKMHSTELATLLLAQPGVVLYACDVGGRTVLHDALASGMEEVARALIVEAPSHLLSAPDDEGRTALHIAVRKRQSDVALLLLAEPSVDALGKDNQGRSPLQEARELGLDSVVDAILARKNPAVGCALQ